MDPELVLNESQRCVRFRNGLKSYSERKKSRVSNTKNSKIKLHYDNTDANCKKGKGSEVSIIKMGPENPQSQYYFKSSSINSTRTSNDYPTTVTAGICKNSARI